MEIDADISQWILDFLLRQPLDDRTLNCLIRTLPLPNTNPSLKRTLLLRKLQSEISTRFVSEKLLELFEQIEELDNQRGIEPSDAMKSAYCAVAVDCTVRYLEGNEMEKYFDAVTRVWRGRVSEMEKRGKAAGLVSEELRSWNDDIEAAVWDPSVCENVAKRRREKDVFEAMRVFVREERERMGPSFLELVAEAAIKGDDMVRGAVGLCERVREGAESLPNVGVLGEDMHVSNSNKEMQKGNMLPRRKHVAKKRNRGATSGSSRGVKIADTEDGRVGTLCNKYNVPPTLEVIKVQEPLEPSSLDLLADIAISRMTRENMDREPVVRNQNKVSANEPNTSVDKSAEGDRANEDNLSNQCRRSLQNNVPKPSLMARNSSAHTFEWDDSTDALPEESPNPRSRPHLPSPRTREVSPLKKHEITNIAKRRKVRRWSTLEEDTLRTGVQKFGKGNWKLILNAYHEIFEERTEVDLKDKWRNMMRH